MARGEIGYRESGTNHQKYSPAVPGLEWSQNQPWCHTFVSWVAMKAGAADIIPRTASCATGASWFKQRNRWSGTPKVGSVVYYGPNGGTHVEIVTEVTATQIKTVGGNTSGSLNGQYFNGDGVYEKWVDRNSSRIHGYGHPAYDDSDYKPWDGKSYPGYYVKYGDKGAEVKAVQRRLVAHGWKLDVDGDFGPQTLHAVKVYQKHHNLEVDGVVGPATWKSLFANDGDEKKASSSTPKKESKPAEKKVTVPPFPGVMRLGSTGAGVRTWQVRMKERGWSLSADGIFGPETLKVVQQFQREKKLVVDGVIGPQTWAAAWTAPVT